MNSQDVLTQSWRVRGEELKWCYVAGKAGEMGGGC